MATIRRTHSSKTRWRAFTLRKGWGLPDKYEPRRSGPDDRRSASTAGGFPWFRRVPLLAAEATTMRDDADRLLFLAAFHVLAARVHPDGIGRPESMMHLDGRTCEVASTAVDGTKRRVGPAALEHSELLPEHEDFDDEACARAKGGDQRAEQGRDDREHHWRR